MRVLTRASLARVELVQQNRFSGPNRCGSKFARPVPHRTRSWLGAQHAVDVDGPGIELVLQRDHDPGRRRRRCRRWSVPSSRGPAAAPSGAARPSRRGCRAPRLLCPACTWRRPLGTPSAERSATTRPGVSASVRGVLKDQVLACPAATADLPVVAREDHPEPGLRVEVGDRPGS